MIILFSFVVLFGHVNSATITRLTNIKCDVLDPSYCSYKECQLKILGRGVVGLNVHALVLQAPFNNAKVNVALLRKYNGFRPFMFNTTFDFCNFMANRRGIMSFPKFVIDLYANVSNINHTCPYKEILIRNLVLKEKHFKFLPLPSGEYQIQLTAASDGKWRTRVYTTFSRQEDLLNN